MRHTYSQFALIAMLLLAGNARGEAPAQTSFDGLVPVPGANVQIAYIDPEADFSVFKRVSILEPFVAFRKNWQRDQNRNRARNVSTRDMQRIKQDVATLFERVFTEKLEAAGYEVVNEPADDVLLLRPAIIDLDVASPDVREPGRTRAYTSTTGAATLYLELFDSVSGEILGRAADREVIRSGTSNLSWSNSVTNAADARRLFGRWADRLVKFLDSHYSGKE